MVVALVRYRENTDSVKKAVELCSGFEGLRTDHRVLIKPNLVIGRKKPEPMPGVTTSAAVIDELVCLLLEFGCQDIAIGEGSIVLPEMGADTPTAFISSGIAQVAKRRGVELIDFNAGAHETVYLDGASVRVSQSALQADFIINVPVLKTHAQTKVSLGMKNLKGFLDMHCKRKFHDKLDLERSIALLALKLPIHLTIIDGTYGLQKGPFGRDAHRMDVLAAGKDVLTVDIVGSTLMGIDPSQVIHLREYAAHTGRRIDIGSVHVAGEEPAEVAHKLEWMSDWTHEVLNAYSVEGVTCDLPGNSNCSGCSVAMFAALERFARHNAGARFDHVEICIGKEPRVKPDSKQVFLLGKCPISTNRGRENAIAIKGCPPRVDETYEALMQHARKIDTLSGDSGCE